MASHKESHNESQMLCDNLLCLMQVRLSGIERNKAEGACSVFHHEGSCFAFLYHRKRNPDIKIYFRADHNLEPRPFSLTINFQKRPKFKSAWERNFPYFFDISPSDNLEEVAEFLIKDVYPLSLKPKQLRTKEHPKQLTLEKVALNERIFPDEIDSTEKFHEGAIRQVTINAYERDPNARLKCIEHYGATCSVCSFNFGKVFGHIGEGFIHVHHLRPISEIAEEYEVDPVKDLRPVCPNCHAMLHRRSPCFSIEEVKNRMELDHDSGL